MRAALAHPAAITLILALGLPAAADVHFTDRAASVGVGGLHYGRGSAMVDLDGDGRLDIIAGDAGAPNRFLRQRPNATFALMNDDWGIADRTDTTWGLMVADFDEDGDPDVYAINGGFVSPQANRMLRNDLATSGVFTDVTASSGDAGAVSLDFGGTVFDFDHDGDLDIFVSTSSADRCRLLRNDGGLSFTDVAAGAGLVETGSFRHCTSGDFDDDGWIDVAVGRPASAPVLYRNQSDGTFLDVRAAAGVSASMSSFGMVLEDFDNDGWLDLYVPRYQTEPNGPSELYLNDGDGTFTDVTAASGIGGQADMGHTTGDLDGDGYPDILIGTGSPPVGYLDKLLLVTPADGALTVTDVSASSGITALGPTRLHGMALGDWDGDGDIDVFANNGGPEDDPSTLEPTALWCNDADGGNWTALRLEGTVSNRTGVGAHAVAHMTSGREIHRRLRVGHGFANTNSPLLHFPVGVETLIDHIEITWPSGIVQVIDAPSMAAIIDVVETAPCFGDLDGDQTVGFTDLLTLLASWGQCADCPGDLNDDALVGFADLLGLLAAWGPCG